MPDQISPEPLRLFIAIPLPEEIKIALENVQRELRHAAPKEGLRWTTRDQLHLTLRFLGNVQTQHVDALTQALRSASETYSALELRSQGLGAFPNRGAPRVLWAAIEDKTKQLPSLQAAIQSATLVFTNEKPEERFAGHITLARVKRIKPSEAKVLAAALGARGSRVFGEWTAREVHLLRSELSAQGAKHTILSIFILGC